MKDILISSSVLILALLALRLVGRRAISRRVQYALWGLVALRLLVPVSLPAADFSVLTAAEPVGQTVTSQLEQRRVYVLPTGQVSLPEREQQAQSLQPGDELAPTSAGVWVVNEDGKTATAYVGWMTAAELCLVVWLGGAALMGLWFLFTNLRFWRRLRKARIPYTVAGCKYPVYLVEDGLPSPCLFGLLRPAVYLTPAAAAPESLRHVLAHETTHARHGDHLWGLVRCVCLCLYWFDPLVWAAALASKADCELACDEGALTQLGEAERIPYGKTLVSLIPVRRRPGSPLLSATTMTAGKRQLKDRITRIAEHRRPIAAALAVVLAVTAAVCAVTFTGGKQAETPRPLTAEELAYFNEEYFNGEGFNFRNQFLTSLYDAPEDIDLFQLFYNGIPSEEQNGLGAPALPDDMWDEIIDVAYDGVDPGCPRYEMSAEEMDGILQRYTGLTLDETNRVGLDGQEENFPYFADGVYFWAKGDTNYFADVQFAAGERQGDTIRLYYPIASYPDCDWLCLTLEAQEDGSYWFRSNQPCAAPVIPAAPTAYPDRDPWLTIPLTGLTPYEPEAVTMTEHRDDCAQVFQTVSLPGHDLCFYRSTDGNIYCAEVLENGTNGWRANCFLTFPFAMWTEDTSLDVLPDVLGYDAIRAYYRPSGGNRVTSFYAFDEDGALVQLLRADSDISVIDLDGDGQRELFCNRLAVESGETGAFLTYRRDGALYQADLAQMLLDAWPEAEWWDYSSLDEAGRFITLTGSVRMPDWDGAAQATFCRDVYFDGENLLVYRDETAYHDNVADTVDAPDYVLAAARTFVLDHYQDEQEGYTLVDGDFESVPLEYGDWRIPALDGPYRETVGSLEIDVWALTYELHTATPERVILAGGRYITEDGWVSQGYPGCDYFYFLVNTDSVPTLLFHRMENDCVPGSALFLWDMTSDLTAGGLLTYDALDEADLADLLWVRPVDLLNRLAERPAAERDRALNTLGTFLAEDAGQDAFEQCARFIQNDPADLTDGGQTAWETLQFIRTTVLNAAAAHWTHAADGAALSLLDGPDGGYALVLTAAEGSGDVGYYDQLLPSSAFQLEPFTNILGRDGWQVTAEVSSGGWTERTYWTFAAGKPSAMAESFGFAPLQDTAADLDGDGVRELVCNVTYNADGVRRAEIYRLSGEAGDPIGLSADIPAVQAGLRDYFDLGINSSWSEYDPDAQVFRLHYCVDRDHDGEPDEDYAEKTYTHREITALLFSDSP